MPHDTIIDAACDHLPSADGTTTNAPDILPMDDMPSDPVWMAPLVDRLPTDDAA